MKIPNEDFENLSRNSKNQKGLFQLLEEKSENIVKKQYNQNELFFAEHYLKDYVNNLKKQTVIGLDEEIRKNLFVKPKRNDDEIGNSKNIRENNKKFTITKKDKVINLKTRRLSNNITARMRLENINYEFEKPKKKSNLRKEECKKKNENNLIINNKEQHRKSISYRKSFEIKKHFISKNKSSNILSKRYLLEKSLLDDEFNSKRRSFINKKNLSLLNKTTVFDGENDSKAIIYDDSNKNNIIKTTHMNNKEIVELNEIKTEMKKTIIGKSTIIGLDSSKLFLIDENGEIKEKKINKKENEKYRILTRKGYVYDSFDDEENLDEIKNFNYIQPNSIILKIIDFFIFIFTFYNLFFIPLFLGMNDNYCIINNGLSLFTYFIDLIFIIDVIISFFVAYYNFDEVLIIDYKLMFLHYLETWFFIDFIAAIPFHTIFIIFNQKCKDNDYLFHSFYNKEFYYLLILLKLLKIFKIISKNQFLNKILKILAKLKYINGRALINIFAFFLSLHIVACIFIFIGKNDYPNWIEHFNYNNKSFKELYLIAIYYTITTLTTVGYGDISCTSSNEKIFGLFMEVIGICAYSWALTEISNYIKVINEKNEELSNKIQILDDIKLNYRHFTDELYERIVRFLKYKHINEKKNIQSIFDELPVGLKNTLIYEMYKPVIHNFNFFKDFPNTDFIVKVIAAFKPIIALKNDILIKNGDLVEEIIFVKKGSLSLEIPFTFQKQSKRRSTRNSKLMRRSALFYNNNARINPLDNNNIYTINEEKKPMKTSFTFINALHKYDNEEKEKIQYFQILKIRRNEHFGDILMLLDQRSPLLLRVKSKKAELFFLNKEDAINISTSYPQYWKTINKKSLFNMEQIKRLTNKFIKIISSQHGIVPKKKKQTIKNTDISSSISIVDDEDSNLKTIPSFSNETDIQTINQIGLINDIMDNEEEENEEEEEEEEEENEEKENSIINKEKKVYDLYQNNIGLQPIIEDDKNKESKSSELSSSSITESGFEKTNKENSTISKSSIYNSNINNKTEGNINNINTSTPFEHDEINTEIYPEENFVISPQLIPNFQVKTIFKDKNNNLNNISICSTEISFSINSEYENIDELSEGNYSKDVIFRTKVNNFIKEEVEYKKGNTRMNKFYSKNSENKTIKFNSFEIQNKKNFIKRTKTTNSLSTNFKSKSLKVNNLIDKKNKDSNRELLNIDSNDEDEKSKNENKKDILNVITQKIEKNNMNLNNPDLFYSKAFKKIIHRNKTKTKESFSTIKNNIKKTFTNK